MANTKINASQGNDLHHARTQGEEQRRKHQRFASDAPSLAAQDEVAQKARMLWAADRVAGRLARAVALVRDGKQPKDPEMVLAALEKLSHVVTDVDEKVAIKRSMKAAQHKSRTDAVEAKRNAEDERAARIFTARKAAEAARSVVRNDRETRRIEQVENRIENKRSTEIVRRTRQVQELVEKEWEREQQHVHLIRTNEVQRRQSARAVQQREREEEVQKEEQRRRRCVSALEREQAKKEASDPQVIKALPGHPALLGGHTRNIAPYAQQHRPLRYQLGRWQHPD